MSGQFIQSTPQRSTGEMRGAFEENIKLLDVAVIPALENEIRRNVDQSDTFGVAVNQAALLTKLALINIGYPPISSFPAIPIQVFEFAFIHGFMGFPDIEEPVVLSGSGGRIPEIYALMDFREFQTMKEMDTTRLGRLPARVHCAEPDPEMSAQRFEREFSGFLPPASFLSTGVITQDKNPGLLLTDDTHTMLSANYGKGNVGRLIINRLDPNSFLDKGRFSVMDDQRLALNLRRGLASLIRMVRVVREGGSALFSVGLGNDMEETAIRKVILTSLRYALDDCKIPYVEVYNPIAQLLYRNSEVLNKDPNEIIDSLLPQTWVQAIAIPDIKLRNLRLLLDRSLGDRWILKQVKLASDFVRDNRGLGLPNFD